MGGIKGADFPERWKAFVEKALDHLIGEIKKAGFMTTPLRVVPNKKYLSFDFQVWASPAKPLDAPTISINVQNLVHKAGYSWLWADWDISEPEHLGWGTIGSGLSYISMRTDEDPEEWIGAIDTLLKDDVIESLGQHRWVPYGPREWRPNLGNWKVEGNMARSKIGGAYNINQSIVNEAEKLGLDAMATGGGLDYIFKLIGKNEDGSQRVVILGDRDDAGSPDYLSSKCELHILLCEDWTDQVSIPVSNARAGMILMASMHDPHFRP